MADDGILEPGALVGDYQIEAELGGGGMGRVYLAKDLTLERMVALKTLAPALRNDELILQRFLLEARAAARLNHPNIVQIYDFGNDGDTFYLAMEYVEGESLAGQLKRGPFPEIDAVNITRYAAQALSVAHAAGLVHRDIKPDNLMLTARGEVKLVDLGVAKRIGQEDSDQQSLTKPGQALGTPHYISPEQIRAALDIDGRADIYSLGATLWHLVTGRTPFAGNTSAQVMSMHLYQPMPDPRTIVPGLSENLVHVLRKMMAKDPADRYADADELDCDLYQLETGQIPEAASAGSVERALFEPDVTAKSHASAAPGPAPIAPRVKPPGNSRPQMSGAALPTPSPAATPAPEVPKPPVATTGGLSADPNLKILETELARHVGPLARVLVKRAAKSAVSLRELIAMLEQEIAGDKPRKAFRVAVDKLR